MTTPKQFEDFTIKVRRENIISNNEIIGCKYRFNLEDDVEYIHDLYRFCIQLTASVITDELKLYHVPHPIKVVEDNMDVDVEYINDILVQLVSLIEYDKNQMNSLSRNLK